MRSLRRLRKEAHRRKTLSRVRQGIEEEAGAMSAPNSSRGSDGPRGMTAQRASQTRITLKHDVLGDYTVSLQFLCLNPPKD